MLEIWLDLPAWLRMIVALALIAVGVAIVYEWLFGGFEIAQYRFLPTIGVALAATGFMMVVVGGKSRAEKNGYRF